MLHILRQMIREKSLRAITGIQLHGILDIPLHRMWHAIVADRTKWFFIDIKETIGSGKRLNQVLIQQYLIQIQSVDPLRVKACEHLIYDD